jgi:SAM-dependent methyltransferase
MFRWDADRIRLMADASEYGDYNDRLAEILSGLLPGADSVCDAGCGLGYLACAMAGRFGSVRAVEISPEAFAVLAKLAQGCENVTPVLGDAAQCPPRTPYDAMVFSFFGRLREILKIGRAQCRGTLAIIKKDYDRHRFSLSDVPLTDETASDAAGLLEKMKIPYRREARELEMGQPFRSLQDAALFFRSYSRDERPETITPEKAAPRLQQTGRADFPYYLPQARRLGILLVETADIPNDWEERYEGTL